MSFRDSQRFRKVYSYYRPTPRVADVFSIDKDYVDAVFRSLDWKQSVRAASTSSVTISGTITAIDGINLADEDRVLLKDQSSPEENGIYVWYSSDQKLVLALDSVQDSLTCGATTYVEEGSTNEGTIWVLSTHDPITVGSTPQTWTQFSGGGGSGIFTTSGTSARTEYSASFGGSKYPNQVGSDVFFYVNGDALGNEKAVFGGDVVVSGSMDLQGDIFEVTGTIRATDGISGSLTNLADGSSYLRAGSNISISTGSNGSITISSTGGGSIVNQWNELSPTPRLNTTASIAIAGNLGSSISAQSIGSDVFFFVSGSIAGNNVSVFGGDLLVSGNISANNGNITTNSSTFNLANSSATTVNIGGSATSVNIGSSIGSTTSIGGNLKVGGNSIKSSTGDTAITLAGSSVIIPGDFTVNGTTTTINTTNLEVKDSVVGLGFSSGTIALLPGDRGWIGGLSNGVNVASFWQNSSSEFVVATTVNSATSSLSIPISSYSNFHARNIQGSIVSASLGFSGSLTRLIDGSSYLRAGNNVSITSASNGAVTISATGGSPAGSDSQLQFNLGGSSFGASSNLTFNSSTNTMSLTGSLGMKGNIIPDADTTYTLGTSDKRWGHIYTGDLHLRNDRGDWTIVEERDFLCVVNNITGKKYKMMLQPLDD